MNGMKVGLKGEISQVVTEHDTAARYGSGLVDSYSTPAMVALIEGACVKSIENYLEKEETSVGIEVNVKHLAPTPVGMKVTAYAELFEINGRRLRFKVKATDDKENISEGTHTRAVVNAAKFAERIKSKRVSLGRPHHLC